jgi:hypothetical protein
MSKPAELPASTPILPVGASEPAFAGDCTEIWSSAVSRSNSVVAVVGSRSLLVYAAAVTPVAGAVAGGYVSVPSTAVVPAAGMPIWSSMLCRRFWPVSLMTRSRFAAGLKSTPNLVPASGTLSWETLVAFALLVLRV